MAFRPCMLFPVAREENVLSEQVYVLATIRIRYWTKKKQKKKKTKREKKRLACVLRVGQKERKIDAEQYQDQNKGTGQILERAGGKSRVKVDVRLMVRSNATAWQLVSSGVNASRRTEGKKLLDCISRTNAVIYPCTFCAIFPTPTLTLNAL